MLVYNKQFIIQYARNEHKSNRTGSLNSMLFLELRVERRTLLRVDKETVRIL
jgi:hypothetical protein